MEDIRINIGLLLHQLCSMSPADQPSHQVPSHQVIQYQIRELTQVVRRLDATIAAILSHHKQSPDRSLRSAAPLSLREAQVADLVALGRGNKEIASALSISEHTVGAHMRRMFRKLHVTSRAALVATLMRSGASKRESARAHASGPGNAPR